VDSPVIERVVGLLDTITRTLTGLKVPQNPEAAAVQKLHRQISYIHPKRPLGPWCPAR
jgi:hypothetical protein